MRLVARLLATLLGGLLATAIAWAPGAAAQDDLSMGRVRSPILTIDVDRLFAETRLGRQASEDLARRTDALAAENERLTAELTAEERSLTERRPGMDVDAFRAEADAFDAEVQRIRAEQDAKQAALEAAVVEGREAFLDAATPVLARLMADSGAAVLLDRRDVFLSADLVDVTDEAIAALDAEAAAPGGDADGPPSGDPAPEGQRREDRGSGGGGPGGQAPGAADGG